MIKKYISDSVLFCAVDLHDFLFLDEDAAGTKADAAQFGRFGVHLNKAVVELVLDGCSPVKNSICQRNIVVQV